MAWANLNFNGLRCLAYRVQGVGFKVQGLGFRMEGLGLVV